MPFLQHFCERRLIAFCEHEHECAQLSARLGLRPACEVLGYLLDLVELACLHRNVFEYSQKSTPSIDDSSGEHPPLFFEDCTTVPVVRHALSFHFVPVDVLLQVH